MKKPQPKIRKYYDYQECRTYLEEKYGYNERDFAHGNKKLDFWGWVIAHDDIHNGCFIMFSREILEGEDTDWDNIHDNWQKEIYQHYIDEFADENGELELYVWW